MIAENVCRVLQPEPWAIRLARMRLRTPRIS